MHGDEVSSCTQVDEVPASDETTLDSTKLVSDDGGVSECVKSEGTADVPTCPVISEHHKECKCDEELLHMRDTGSTVEEVDKDSGTKERVLMSGCSSEQVSEIDSMTDDHETDDQQQQQQQPHIETQDPSIVADSTALSSDTLSTQESTVTINSNKEELECPSSPTQEESVNRTKDVVTTIANTEFGIEVVRTEHESTISHASIPNSISFSRLLLPDSEEPLPSVTSPVGICTEDVSTGAPMNSPKTEMEECMGGSPTTNDASSERPRLEVNAPLSECVCEPVTEPVTESVTESVTEPTIEPTTEPVTLQQEQVTNEHTEDKPVTSPVESSSCDKPIPNDVDESVKETAANNPESINEGLEVPTTTTALDQPLNESESHVTNSYNDSETTRSVCPVLKSRIPQVENLLCENKETSLLLVWKWSKFMKSVGKKQCKKYSRCFNVEFVKVLPKLALFWGNSM